MAVTGRHPAKNQAIGQELGDPGLVLPLDVRDEEAVEGTVSQVVERLGRLAWIIHGSSGRVNKKEHRPVGCGC